MKVPESHTSENILNNIKLVQSRWGIENKTCDIVCDNAPNIVKAVQALGQDLLLRCAAHSIQLSVNIGLKNHDVKELIIKLRKIVGYFHRSAVAQTDLENEQERYNLLKNKLIQDCITSWNSMYDMLVSISNNKNPINNTLASNTKTENWLISSNDSSKIDNLIQILEPFKAVTELLGSDKYVTSSITSRLFKNLSTAMKINNNDCEYVKNVKSNISLDLIKRRNYLGNVIYKAAALDPQYCSLKFLTEQQKTEIWKELEQEIENGQKKSYGTRKINI